jgi:hypothetical protein
MRRLSLGWYILRASGSPLDVFVIHASWGPGCASSVSLGLSGNLMLLLDWYSGDAQGQGSLLGLLSRDKRKVGQQAQADRANQPEHPARTFDLGELPLQYACL